MWLERWRTVRAVIEPNLFEPDIAPDAHRFSRDVPTRLDRFVDNLKNTLAGGPSRLHQLIELMQFVDRFIQKAGEHQERTERWRASRHSSKVREAVRTGHRSRSDQESL